MCYLHSAAAMLRLFFVCKEAIRFYGSLSVSEFLFHLLHKISTRLIIYNFVGQFKTRSNFMNRSRSKKFTRGKFLPLPAPIVRATSLQNHLALEALRSRHGTSLHATFLFRAVYLTYLLCDANDQHEKTDTFQEAEAALGRCSHRAQAGGSWQLPESDIDVFHCVLTLHDKQLQSVPAHLYEAACEQLLNYVVNGGEPVIRAAAGDECVQ